MRWASTFLAGVLCVGSAPAGGPAPDPAGGTGGPPMAGTLIVTVVEAGTSDPIAGAWVMAGAAENDPFPGNVLFTDPAGQASFADPALNQPITVTAGDTGHAYTTIVGNGASQVVLPLASLDPVPTALVGDDFAGIEVNNGFFCIGDGNIDVGLVLPALSIESVLSGNVLSAIPTATDLLSTPLGDIAVPINVYVPEQCELFQTFKKESYHVRVPTGRRTLFGITARAALSDLLNFQDIIEVVQSAELREMDILRDVNVTGDSNGFDLSANLGLTANLTLQVSNGLPGTTVLAAAIGRLTTSEGGEEVIATGIDGFDPDTDGPAANLLVETRAAVGELSDMIHGAVVSQIADAGQAGGATTTLIRSGFTPPTTLSFSQFYEIVQVSSTDASDFSWSSVLSGTSPPTPDVNVSRLVYREPLPDPDEPGETFLGRQTYWTLYSRGSDLGLSLPTLPVSAPTPLPDPGATFAQDRLDFDHTVQRLGDDPDGFDYHQFALADTSDFATHVTVNGTAVPCDSVATIGGLRVTKGAGPAQVVLTWDPAVDICREAYDVYLGHDPEPLAEPGDFPNDPPFVSVTDEDIDLDATNEIFTHVAPPDTLVLYIVVDRGSSGNPGPAGHY